MGQYTGGGRFVTKGWRFADFGVKFLKSYYFYDIIYFTSNIYIYIYQEFDVCLVMDQFQRVSTFAFYMSLCS